MARQIFKPHMMPLRKRFNLAFGLVFIAALTSIFGSAQAFYRYENANRARLANALALKAQEDDLLAKVVLEVQYARSFMYTGDEDYLLKYQLANQDVAVAYQALNEGLASVQIAELPALQRLALLHSEFNSAVSELFAIRRSGDAARAVQDLEARVDPLVEELMAALDQTTEGIELAASGIAREDTDRMRFEVYGWLSLFVVSSLSGLGLISRMLRPMLDQLEVLTGAMERSKASPLHEIIPAPVLHGGRLGELVEAYNQLASRQTDLRKRNLDFLEVLCHKMRSPLASILGYSVLLADPKSTLEESDRQKFVQTITRQTEALAQLVDDVLRAARLEDDQTEMVFTPVQVESLLMEVVKESQSQSGRTIHMEDGNGPVVISGDPLRLREMLVSLLDNALKISSSSEPVTVRLEKNERQREVGIEIRDRGRGLTRSDKAAVIEQFGRLRTRQSASGVRTNGLGMYIASRIVQAHHGHIEFESQPDKGSSFKIILPMGMSEVQNG